MLRLANIRRSLRSLNALFGHLMLPLVTFATCAHSLRSFALVAKTPFGRLTLPLVAFATCAHSLHSFALVAKAPFGRLATCAHSLRSFALVAPKGRSIGLYCELRVIFASLRFTIRLSLARHSCSIRIALLTRHS